VATNPYAAPTARVADTGTEAAAPALWNPNAAASWSLIFSPAFGAFLHMLNWRALGDQQKAAAAKTWFVVSLAMLLVYLGLAVILPDSKAADGLSRAVGLAYLLTWYFAAGRPQAQLVKEKYGADYPRKGWGKPILIGIGAMVGYIIIAIIVGVAIAVAQGH